MTIEAVLDRLVEVGPVIINQHVKPGAHCVLATSIGQMVLERLGVEAEPYPVAVSVFNQAWVDWSLDQFQGGVAEQVRRGAYLLSNVPDFRGASFLTVNLDHPWDGHLVLRVPDNRRMWLVDLDLGSFNRPSRQIILPLGLVAPLSVGGVVSGTVTDDSGVQTTVEYEPLVAPYANDYQTARDWTERDRFEGHVDELMRAMRGV